MVLTQKFTTKELDEGIDLTYFGARYYDQDLGVWTSPDPARQFHSGYSYDANPINSIDPDGRQATQAYTAVQLGFAAMVASPLANRMLTSPAGLRAAELYTKGSQQAMYTVSQLPANAPAITRSVSGILFALGFVKQDLSGLNQNRADMAASIVSPPVDFSTGIPSPIDALGAGEAVRSLVNQASSGTSGPTLRATGSSDHTATSITPPAQGAKIGPRDP